MISAAKRPLILAGRGIRASGSTELFRQIVGHLKVPVVFSLLGLDTLEFDNPYRLGFIGVYGNRWANIALKEADFLLVVGSRLDIRQTGADTESFSKGKKIVHVDIEKDEINERIKGCLPVVGDLNHFLEDLMEVVRNESFFIREEWQDYVFELKTKYPDTNEQKKAGSINPNSFVHELATRSEEAAYIAT